LKGIDFQHLRNDQVSNLSVVEIKHPETYENDIPKEGGLLDTCLGTTSIQSRCGYCGLNGVECEGHFGHITLGSPQFHGATLSKISSIFSVIDLDFCKAFVTNENAKKRVLFRRRKYRLKELKLATALLKKSPFTGFPIPKVCVDINRNKRNCNCVNIVCEYAFSDNEDSLKEKFLESREAIFGVNNVLAVLKVVRVTLCPEECYKILQCISDEDCNLLGCESPKDFILKTYPIPPVSIRPSLRKDMSSTRYGENNLTQKISDIVKWNNKYIEEKNRGSVKVLLSATPPPPSATAIAKPCGNANARKSVDTGYKLFNDKIKHTVTYNS
jgi:DNA-directed RNA polymerase II subunit RPB1